MLRTTIFVLTVGLVLPAYAEEKTAKLPKNTIDCSQFTKRGPQEWIENGTAVFNLGSIEDINLTNQPVTPGYYRFDGIDVYNVLEQKCGAAAQPAPSNESASSRLAEPAMAATEPNAPPVGETQSEPPTAKSAAADESPTKTVNGLTDGKCDKPVYSAGAAAEGAGASVEIAFGDKKAGEGYADFILRKMKNNEVEWSYKGKMRPDKFIFTPMPSRQADAYGRVVVARQEPVTLQASYIKPARDGAGEPILYIRGMRSLFASKEDTRRFKFEGGRPAEPLPEAFYFDRCE
jgi:hypothetical protein